MGGLVRPFLRQLPQRDSAGITLLIFDGAARSSSWVDSSGHFSANSRNATRGYHPPDLRRRRAQVVAWVDSSGHFSANASNPPQRTASC